MMVSYAAEFIVNKVEVNEVKNKRGEDNEIIFAKIDSITSFCFCEKWWENF